MSEYKRPGGFGDRGGNKFGPKRDFGGRPSFGARPSFGGNRGAFGADRGPRGFGQGPEMHQAICAQCGKTCEVPFRPNGKKPVFCKECFDKNEGNAPQGNFAPKGSFGPAFGKPSAPFVPPSDDKRIDDLKRQVETIGIKLDRLIALMAPAPKAAPAAKAEVAAEKPVKKGKKPSKR